MMDKGIGRIACVLLGANVAMAFVPVIPAGSCAILQPSCPWRFPKACGLRAVVRADKSAALGATMECESSSDHPPLPALPGLPSIEIEYCTGCRWMLRGAWLAQELLTTFDGEIARVSLMPSRARGGGIFDVRVNGQLVWDRKEMGRFPEAKELKQRIRDMIAPDKDLGHSDRTIEADFREDGGASLGSDDVAGRASNVTSKIEMLDDDEAEGMRRMFGVM